MTVRASSAPPAADDTSRRDARATWHGVAELKRATLAQMARHREAPVPRFAALEVGGRAIAIYGWTAMPARLDLAAEALGLPEDLLVLGWHLFEGYPDTDEAVAEEIALKMDFLGQIPVGVDATQVAARFVAGCLLDRLGVLAAPSGPADRALIAAVGEAVLEGAVAALAPLGAEADARVAALGAELRACREGETAESLRLRREQRALEATSAACRVFEDPRAVLGVVAGALEGPRGDGTWDVDRDFEPLVARLSALLNALISAQGGGRAPA